VEADLALGDDPQDLRYSGRLVSLSSYSLRICGTGYRFADALRLAADFEEALWPLRM
jgi:hypothetical protein